MNERLKKLQKDLEAIKADLERLSGFRDTVFTRKFRRQLEGEKSVILQKIRNLTISKSEKAKQQLEKLSVANKNRRIKMKRSWDYFRSIQKNYRPDLSLKQIRSLFKKHRQGLETDIPDVAWRNPSP